MSVKSDPSRMARYVDLRDGVRPKASRQRLRQPMSPVTAGIVAAAAAAVSSLLTIVVLATFAWLPHAETTTWNTVGQLAVGMWLVSQHVHVSVLDMVFSLPPAGITLIVLAWCSVCARWMTRWLDPQPQRAGIVARRMRYPALAVVSLAVAHGLLAMAVLWIFRTASMSAPLWQAVVGPTLVALVGGAWGAAKYWWGSATAVRRGVHAVLPGWLRPWLTSSLTAILVLVAAAAAVVVIALSLGYSRMLDVQLRLGADVADAFGMFLLHLAFLPIVVLWAMSWLAGPGFAVGSGTQVALGHVSLGQLPAIPMLTALPAPGTQPGWFMCVLAVGVVAGMAGYWRMISERGAAQWWSRAADLVALATLTGLMAAAMVWFATGSAGPGRMSHFGARPESVGAAVFLEVGLGAILTLVIRIAAPAAADAWFRWRHQE